ncbi:MAG: Rne/Rng family ribonuclease [Phycisphaerae bacterium]
MAEQKKSPTVKKRRKTTRTKKVAAAAATPEATEAVAPEGEAVATLQAPADGAPATETPTPVKKAKRKTSRPRKKKTPVVEQPESAAAVAEPPAPADTTTDVEAEGSEAQVEQAGGAIVIRFPPVAPPPFQPLPEKPQAAREPEPVDVEAEVEAEAPPVKLAPPEEAPADEEPALAPEEPEPVAEFTDDTEDRGDLFDEDVEPSAFRVEEPAPDAGEQVEAGETPAPRKRRRRGRRRKPRSAAPGADQQPAEARQSAGGDRAPSTETAHREPADEELERPATSAQQRLTPSQKRRMRRRRRTETPRDGEPVARPALAPAPEPAAALEPAEDEFDEDVEPIEPIEPVEPSEPASVAIADAPAPAPEDDNRRGRRGDRRSRRGRRSGGKAQPKPAEFSEEDDEPARASHVRPDKEMIINVFPREECRIAILHKGVLEEIYIERASSENHVGNIYKGVVTNVEPSIQAAFVDFGLGKNGFLHISDLHPQYFPDGGQPAENVGCKIPRRNRPPIQRCLRRGQQVIVQITKEGIGTKGPTLSTYLSIPGRFLVMMPGMRRLGVSRKIEDEDTRHTLRHQLGELELPDGIGFIARTAAQGRTKRELQSDLRYLVRLWRAVEKRIQAERAPAELYRESDLVIRTIRDLYSAEIGRIVVDDTAVASRAREFLHIFSPRSGDVVTEYTEARPVFHKYGVEAELDRLHSRHVPLKSGGSLVIESTEALVAIDVNSGRFRTEDDAEATAYKINCEAADEIARQLRLRDLGGVIICDFIDMRVESHKREIERRLAQNLKAHKERAKILRMSAFGIIEMTRQRQRASLTRSAYQDCPQCRGTGMVRTAESVTLDVMRTLQINAVRDNVYLIEVTVSQEVGDLLLNRKRALLHDLETKHRRTIAIRTGAGFGLDQVDIRCWDQRGRTVPQI